MNERWLYVLWTFISAHWMNGSHGKRTLLLIVCVFVGSGGVFAIPAIVFIATSRTGSNLLDANCAIAWFPFSPCECECVACLRVITVTSRSSSYYHYLCEGYRFGVQKLSCSIEFSFQVRSSEEMRAFPSNNVIRNWTVFVQLSHCHWRRPPRRHMDRIDYLDMLFLWPNHFTHTQMRRITSCGWMWNATEWFKHRRRRR